MSWEIFYVAAGHALPPVAAGTVYGKAVVILIGTASAIAGVIFGNPSYAALDVIGAIIGIWMGLSLSKAKK